MPSFDRHFHCFLVKSNSEITISFQGLKAQWRIILGRGGGDIPPNMRPWALRLHVL